MSVGWNERQVLNWKGRVSPKVRRGRWGCSVGFNRNERWAARCLSEPCKECNWREWIEPHRKRPRGPS